MKIVYSCWKLLVTLFMLMVIYLRVPSFDLAIDIIEGSPYALQRDW
jgi:hypothetical protein